jgi:unsaturated chondroitin disaccharide hydrolase
LSDIFVGRKYSGELRGSGMAERLFVDALDLCARKLLEDEPTLGVSFPYVTAPSGAWVTMPASLSAGYRGEAWSHGNWFCGFWVGLLLIAYLRTRDERYLNLADQRLLLVAPRATDGNTHDIGFIFYPSAAAAHHITGERRYGDLALRAAQQLRRRLIMTRKGSYISSWGPLDDKRGRCSSAIDTMANLPLLYWAGNYDRDASFTLAGESHANMTRTAFIRPDCSTYHAVEYDSVTGERRRGFTFQGYADLSCWSRGQAWAIYGYVRTAEATGKRAYLDLAEILAQYYIERTGPDMIPFWDFDDPGNPDAPKDSSATAIVASALLDLAALHPEEKKAARWKAQALTMLTTLCERYLATEATHRGLLRQGCYSRPHNEGVVSAVIFGDFFFAEALCSAVMPGRLRAVPSRLAA